MTPVAHLVKNGYVIHGDVTGAETQDLVKGIVTGAHLIIADPPYGNIVNEKWDRVNTSDDQFVEWMIGWTKSWSDNVLLDRGAFYVWGGIGRPGFRPFMKYMHQVEKVGSFELANMITWSKRRGYGVQNNYLFTREECAYFTKGNAKKPLKFNVPYLDAVRGYAGYNAKYPAKSENYRRTNVWTDITELMRGKVHPTQKARKLYDVIIEAHTDPGDWVIDLFAGSGVAAEAAIKTGRKFVVIESDEKMVGDVLDRLNNRSNSNGRVENVEGPEAVSGGDQEVEGDQAGVLGDGHTHEGQGREADGAFEP